MDAMIETCIDNDYVLHEPHRTRTRTVLARRREQPGQPFHAFSTYHTSYSPTPLPHFALQGMDARYERAVHNTLVEVTCTADSGQYFLIMPKLLTGLQYHARMKVLCVSNGEWLPDESERTGGSMMGVVRGVVERRARAS